MTFCPRHKPSVPVYHPPPVTEVAPSPPPPPYQPPPTPTTQPVYEEPPAEPHPVESSKVTTEHTVPEIAATVSHVESVAQPEPFYPECPECTREAKESGETADDLSLTVEEEPEEPREETVDEMRTRWEEGRPDFTGKDGFAAIEEALTKNLPH